MRGFAQWITIHKHRKSNFQPPQMSLSIIIVYFIFFVFFFVHNVVNGFEIENIVGGNKTAEKEFPYVVFVNGPSVGSCGGALISPSLVLTAGHCFYDNDYKHIVKADYKVIAGTNDLTKNGKWVNVSHIYTHKKFTVLPDYTVLFDIAVIQLKERLGVSKGSRFRVLQLTKNKNDDYTKKLAVIAGFGFDQIKVIYNPKTKTKEEIGSSDKTMKSANVRIFSKDKCPETDPNLMCGQVVQGLKEEPRGVCAGDSGSILVQDTKAIGILSTSPEGCNERNTFATYTRVAPFLPFILGIMSNQLTSETAVTTLSQQN